MSKEQCPVILPPDADGNTQINPIYEAYMGYITIGKRYDEMGLTLAENRKIVSKLKEAGVEFPKPHEWFASSNQRKIIHAVDEGAQTYAEIEKITGIPYDSIKTSAFELRKPNGTTRTEGIRLNLKRSKLGEIAR